MNIFSIFGQNKQEPEWTYTAHGSIWRILFSTSGKIVGECRDHQQKRATFFCLEEATGSVVWQDVQLNEPWWIGIDAVQQEVVLLHEFANPSKPEHKGIIAYDVEQGTKLWQNDELTFWFAYRDSVYGYKTMFEKRVGYKISLRTGQVEEEFGDAVEELQQLRQLAVGELVSDDFLFPEILDLQALEPAAATLVKKETKGSPVRGDIEFIQHHPYLLLNYYTSSNRETVEAPALANHFSVFNIERQSKIYSDILATDATAPTPDSFFIKGPMVYFIKNRHTLTALRLSK